MSKKEITCYCEHKIAVDIPETIDIAKQPEVLDEIIEGTFFSFVCEKCSTEMKPEFPISLFDKSKDIEMLFLPELERAKYLLGKTTYKAKRIVIGYPELTEKVIIIKENLDDRIIEILKFLLLEKSSDPDKTMIYFAGIDSKEEQQNQQTTLVFHIHGLQDGEVGVTRLPLNIYHKIEQDLVYRMSEEPFKDITTPPYISINKITMEGE